MTIPLLEASHISKAFYHPIVVQILNGIFLKVHAGESVAIVGRSGEGKSTLLQILGTLEDPCHGSLYIEGQKVLNSNRTYLRNAKIGFVFQSFHLLEDYTALENVLMPAWIGRQPTGRGSYAEKRAFFIRKSGFTRSCTLSYKIPFRWRETESCSRSRDV